MNDETSYTINEKLEKSVTMGLNKSFCGGPGGSIFKKRPLAAGGKENKK
ncbi:MAG: hypothetical protein KAW12_05140 [Candidatus Aminicenantes bacterium]|nr:hypothetical protein [Candidatus Aminicenantes bacterium]